MYSSTLWLGGSETSLLDWTWSTGQDVSWSLWEEDSQNATYLGCMVFDGNSRRLREEPCDSNEVAGFLCKKTGLPHKLLHLCAVKNLFIVAHTTYS